ncbi:MAG: EAL domain-containing protein [Moraxella sp.]|uniref:EAL domain-containing protein n=1 Tax=Moraxella sp. TaxID=479 RepID=UPI0026DAFA02|nr:EAL domain-containing protein [Moraxella sp.]MDO4449705.1 EAL domain-containing protein [Moraxella sp.]
MKKNVLNLLFIDEEQLYAEHLIEHLSAYFDEVNLGFWDDKAEFVKSLRQEWDVLVFHRAYDMNFTDVVGIIQEEQVSLPVIHLVQSAEQASLNEQGSPEVIHGDMVKSLVRGDDKLIVATICLQAAYIRAKRQTNHLKSILKEAEQRANILIKNSKSAVAYIDQGVHIFANDPYLEMFGYKAMEEIIGVPVVDLIAGGDNVKGFKQFLRKFDKGDRSQVEFAFESKRTDGSTFASKLQLAAATLEGEPVTQMIIQQNEGNSAELAKKLAEAERQDSLTGLPNRLAFTERLEAVRGEVARGELKSAALLYVRVDGMGKIHSSTGLAGVDTAIKQVGWVLDETAKKSHTAFVGRFSDSSFAVVVESVNKEQAQALAEQLSERVAGLLIEVGSRTVTTSLSVGVVVMETNTPEASVVLSRAMDTAHEMNPDDESMKVKVFDISSIAGEDDSAMAEYIQTALTQNKLILKYQPLYDIETDSSSLFEVFITLPQADGTEMTYDKLVPIAKKHNLLDKLDRWMLINASKHLATIRQTEPTARILVGLSSASLADTSLAGVITQLVRAIGGDHQVLTLQFNEQDLVDYMAVAKRQFIALANIDCPVGMNGFGVTAKSAEILEYLSPNVVRLARSYTKDLDRPDNLSALQGLIHSANEKSANVIMPYIEEASTMSMAWSVGARYLQGDYLQPASTEIVFPPPAEEA